MKDKKDIKLLSKEIIRLEDELRKGNNKKENEQEIEELVNSLSIKEALQLDEYIMEHYKK